MFGNEQIIMTPKGKTTSSTTILVERRQKSSVEKHKNAHVGGGQHSGIIINKDFATGKSMYDEEEQARTAQDFFKELVAPLEFPRDYVGFIKKIMKMMQLKYSQIRKIEIELRQLSESEHLPERPCEEANETLSEEKLLEIIESAYPNPIMIKDVSKRWSASSEDVELFTASLTDKGLIKTLAPGCYTRVVQNETDVQIVKQMPTISSNKQPTIAIITAQYAEKLAVDTMIENQETFVRYTTVGESNVYTLGNIGAHRVVCTKLPQVGHDRSAAIAAGNTTTRLLGTFQKVDHVFLVGVAGGVPHFTDYNKHVRLGDVIVSSPSDGGKYIYMYCDGAKRTDDGAYKFETKSWGPSNLILQTLAQQLKEMGEEGESSKPWLTYIEEAKHKLLSQDIEFIRPDNETDKLYMSIGGSDVIQVSHPLPPEGIDNVRRDGEPRIHLGPIASGRAVISNEQTRQEFANKLSVLAFDREFDAVIESVYGNRKDHYTLVRGICDYRDGTRGREWQPIAALAAAAFTKSIICALDPPADDE
ncbi:hypothetical protein Anas_08736 [Armadillidium nasatum]|uniref:Winged helix-turn-helix domain-containing protein n=1 Tax=Armadillidium nasatum TaxID=96803 RepID=A0A5N5SKJ4_9CRUS|nr:hypothetical protein Anas_08736 [Armadillidium nasatum]